MPCSFLSKRAATIGRHHGSANRDGFTRRAGSTENSRTRETSTGSNHSAQSLEEGHDLLVKPVIHRFRLRRHLGDDHLRLRVDVEPLPMDADAAEGAAVLAGLVPFVAVAPLRE